MVEQAPWFVTFVTHNSRVSERMIEYGVQHGEPVLFSSNEQVVMLTHLLEACRRYEISLLACNLLPDHVHLIIMADSLGILRESVRKIKGYSAYAFRQTQAGEAGQSIWAQKFHYEAIPDEAALLNMVEYIQHNHLKHAERWGDGLLTTWETRLKPLIETACMPLEEVFKQQG